MATKKAGPSTHELTIAAIGNKASVDKHRILHWLDEKAPRSVVYVSFGSIVRHSPAQVLEIGRGLEASGRAFLWVIKEVDASSPEAPQAAILSHPAIGGFVTHCGWNSVVEAVSEGVPMATWPHFSSDQYINERLIVDVQRTGVAVGVTVPDAHVGAEEIEKAVSGLMDGGEKGEGRRERARELGRKAKEAMEIAAIGNKASVDKHRILHWLDEKAPRSVVYVSFGSIVRHSPAQVLEIGRGLEASGRAFLWVIKEVDASSPEAPQAAILSHPAIGGFVTHCGWNSVVEAVSEGVPMATWPHFSSDQYINERLIVDVQRTGVAVGVTVPDAHVGAEEIEKAVSGLMDGGEKGEGRRERARELGRKAKEAMEVGGSSYANVTRLIHYASHHGQAQG
ncbi:hypothetical protein C4D60_Mb04t27370 [Musa balbisiana]|uniref:UDP-glycosyltransferases domain-containing protein n=1 Tax=Musa balbisiana TaxID=52838 RepID=A0A4S8KF52_MUSBA|nr:hypothetical protein C4D60_Mb04t27370 [Musa balbisiana]